VPPGRRSRRRGEPHEKARLRVGGAQGMGFRMAGRQHVYNAAASTLGQGTYRADIRFHGCVAGSAGCVLELACARRERN